MINYKGISGPIQDKPAPGPLYPPPGSVEDSKTPKPKGLISKLTFGLLGLTMLTTFSGYNTAYSQETRENWERTRLKEQPKVGDVV